MRTLFSVIMIAVTTWLHGQELIPFRPWNAVKIEATSVFDPLNPNIRFGFEKSLMPSWTIQVEAGPIVSSNMWHQCSGNGCVAPNHQGFRAGVELRRYMQEKYYSPWHGIYVAAELYYLENAYQYASEWGTWGPDPADSTQYVYSNVNYRKYDVDKTEFGFNIKVGHQLDTRTPVGVEIFMGLGIKYKNVSRKQLTENFFEDQEEIDGTIFSSDAAGQYFRPAIPMGLRLIVQV